MFNMKIKSALNILILLMLTSCGPNIGFCECENQDANKYYQWGPLALSQEKRVKKMCQSRAAAYNTTCTLTVSGSK
jgi:hypothetical protein